jgi:hypothetical protein
MDIDFRIYGKHRRVFFFIIFASTSLLWMTNNFQWEPGSKGKTPRNFRRSYSFSSESFPGKSSKKQPQADSWFVAKGDDGRLFFQSSCVILEKESADGLAEGVACLLSSRPLPPPQLVLRMEFAEKNAYPQWQGKPSGGEEGIFVRSEKMEYPSGREKYQWIQYQEIFRGIDLLVRGELTRIECDFAVAPQCDPGRIKLRFSWNPEIANGHFLPSMADKGEGWLPIPCRIEAEGMLRLETSRWVAFLPRSCVYQEMRNGWQAVPVDFHLAGDNLVDFKVGPYQKNQPLFIDPLFSHATFYWKDVNVHAVLPRVPVKYE